MRRGQPVSLGHGVFSIGVIKRAVVMGADVLKSPLDNVFVRVTWTAATEKGGNLIAWPYELFTQMVAIRGGDPQPPPGPVLLSGHRDLEGLVLRQVLPVPENLPNRGNPVARHRLCPESSLAVAP